MDGEVKSILIDNNIHKKLKKYSIKSGMKIKSITEKAIEEFITKEEKNG